MLCEGAKRLTRRSREARHRLHQTLRTQLECRQTLTQSIMQVATDALPFALAGFKNLSFQLLAPRHIGADRDILNGALRFIQERHNGRLHPIERPGLRTVHNLSSPNPPAGNGLPEFNKETTGVMSRIENAMILPKQFAPRIPRNLAELLVGVGDGTLGISDSHDRMLVEGRLHIPQFTTGGRHLRIFAPGLQGLPLDHRQSRIQNWSRIGTNPHDSRPPL